jgi:glycine/D-amino acid oxidase-like deaminating enzyme
LLLITKCSFLKGLSLTCHQGWFDPWSLLQNMRRKAVADGVTIVNGAVLDLSLSTSGAGVEHAKIQDRDGRFHEMRADKYVMAMGAWAGAACMDSVVKQLGGLGSYDVWPVRPRRRCVFNFHSPAALEQGADRAPLTVDPSGVYFRPEGKGSARFICGVSPSKEKGDCRYCFCDDCTQAHPRAGFEALQSGLIS